MKKFIAIIIAITLCLAFAGCANTTENTTPTENDIPTTTATKNNSSIPNAKEFPEVEWPTFGIITKVPAIDWSNHGAILIDSETGFWGQVGYSTVDNFTGYVKACQKAGYTEDYYSVPGYFYYGADSEGRAVQLTYNQYDHYIAIQVTIDAASWNHWWAKE